MKKGWLSPKVEIRPSKINGQGLFAKKLGEKIVIWGKANFTDLVGAQKAKEKGKLIMQWDNNLFSFEDRGDDQTYFINHSCDSNLWMEDAFTLSAKRDIGEGEEITADYALWESDEDFISQWECRCDSPFCRGGITGKDYQLSEVQKRYFHHFSPLINKRIFTKTKTLSHN